MKVRVTLEDFMHILVFCKRRIGDSAFEECRELAESGNIKAAAEQLNETLAALDAPLPLAYWKNNCGLRGPDARRTCGNRI